MKLLWREFRIFIIIGLVLAVPLGGFGFMLADNQFPYTYFEEGSHIIPSQVPEGHQLTVYWHIKVNRSCDGSVQRLIIDGRSGVVEATYDAAVAAPTVDVGSDHLVRTFLLPPGITPGPKKYRANLFYRCNLLQQFYPLKGTTPTLSFEVVDTKAASRN